MDLNRRSFLGLLAGAAGAAAVGELPAALALETRPSACFLEPGQTVQEAIDGLGKGGGTVFLKSGTYIVGTVIVIPRNVQLIAEGDLTIEDCRISAASPIRLEGENNVISGCLLEATDGLQAFFEIPTKEETSSIFFGNVMKRFFGDALELFRRSFA